MRHVVTLALVSGLAGAVAVADEGPTLAVPSISIQLYRVNGFTKAPKGPEDMGTWSWTPRVKFEVLGPVPAGSAYTFELPWVTVPLKENGRHDTSYPRGTTELEGGFELRRDQGVTTTGSVPFKIRLKNDLTGVDGVVFQGSLDVKKAFVKDEPKKKNTFEYYVDRDGDLPIGYLWGNDVVDTNNFPLYGGVWLRGDLQGEGRPTFHLIHDGKPVCSPKEGGQAGGFTNEAGAAETHVAWSFVIFAFTECARVSAAQPDFLPPGAIVLAKNPGDYQVKVLRNGKLSRTLAFTVGADGKIVDAGLASQAHLGVPWVVVPVTIAPDADPGQKLDREAWKKQALLGNPLPGFKP
jgi:hypothetical protein